MKSLQKEWPRTRRNRVNEAINLALAVTASITAFNAEAQIPCPITAPINITDTQFNAVTCNNYSALTVLSPGGGLTNQYMATLNNQSGATLTNNQQLDNFWQITNYSGGTLSNTGTLYQAINTRLDNNGELHNHATVNNYGSLVNSGVSATLINQSSGVIDNTGWGRLSNNGGATIENYGHIVNNLSNYSGILSNHRSGIIDIGKPYGSLLNYGSLYNQGTLNSSVNGNIFNAGTISNESTGILNNGGNRFDNYNGVINNTGTVNNNILLRNGGNINNQSGGTLTNTSDIRNYNGGAVTNAGLFEVSATGSIYGDGTGAFLQTDGGSIIDGSLQTAYVNFTGGTLLGNGVVGSAAPITVGASASVNPGRTMADDPVNYTGDLSITGDLTLNGKLFIEIADLTGFDLINISGNAMFSPVTTVQFILADSFAPQAGDTITFLVSTNLINWEDVNYTMTGLPSGLEFEVFSNTGTDLVLGFMSITSISDLLNELQILVDDGILKAGQANSLSRPLFNAQRELDNERIEKACKHLLTFISKVNAMTPTPLDAATAAQLVSSAETILASLECS